jgi:lipoprotein-releasing system ATP-binding protein
MNSSDLILEASQITKSYPQGASELQILKGVTLSLRAGETVSVVGSSGSGKSTLLHILSSLDRPSGGTLSVTGKDILSLSDDEVAQFRAQTMGYVFQFHYLLSEFTALENVMIPYRILDDDKVRARKSSEEVLELMGLKDRMNHFPAQLSGGELQRVAIARAIVRKPKILFADEPTGNLDSKNSMMIQNLFFDLKRAYGLTLVVVTHDTLFASKFSRVLRMSDGKLEAPASLSF